MAAFEMRILGVRHHGPGSARAVRKALGEYQPDCVVLEAPADAESLFRWITDPALRPPVAVLAWAETQPSRAAFWPFAVFSPEWQALTWATEAGVPVRAMDLPAAHTLAEGEGDQGAVETDAEPSRADPISQLAEAAGYDDPEAWWEDVVELRGDESAFEALTEAMAELRAADAETDPRTLTREAHMRKVLRAVKREGHERVAVVCGAWHAPALRTPWPRVADDNALLKGLPKTKVKLTWVPWTNGRLAMRSGYGAGVTSPGWYHHLFTVEDDPIAAWLTQVAGVLRRADLPVSTAHIIEGVRLAEALAALRGRPAPGLTEVQEATLAVLCEGNALAQQLVTRDAVVGEGLGEVPDDVPTVPLDADLRATAKRLRLNFEATVRALTLDLRKPNDLARSQFLRRLRILGINWGEPKTAYGKGTFKEGWAVAWEPGLSVAVVDAARHGTTVEEAAGAALLESAEDLVAVTEAVEQALAADLEQVLEPLLARLDGFAAREADIGQLLRTLPPLARAQRYGDVRRTDTDRLALVARQVLARAMAGLPSAASGISPEAAATLRSDIDGVQGVVGLLAEDDQRAWTDALTELAGRPSIPGTIAGRATRILLAGGAIDADDAASRLSRVLSAGMEPAEQATWVEGFLAGDSLLLVHDRRLLGIIDEWVQRIDAETFTDVLPILRRAFGQWSAPARTQVAAAVRNLGTAEEETADEFHPTAADEPVLAAITLILRGANA